MRYREGREITEEEEEDEEDKFESLFLPDYCIETTMTVEMVLPLLPSTQSVKRGRDKLRVTSFMMCIPEGRDIYVTLVALRSLEDCGG